MTASVIASETTKHIKSPLSLSHLLLPRSLFPDGVITQFALRKWSHSESSTFQWADGPRDTAPPSYQRDTQTGLSVISPSVVEGTKLPEGASEGSTGPSADPAYRGK